jgi:hypothetical protein
MILRLRATGPASPSRTIKRSFAMQPIRFLILLMGAVLALATLAGCSGSSVTSRHAYSGPKLARPSHIIVHDFAATASDVESTSPLNGSVAAHATPQTSEQIALGRQLGAEVARELVAEIRKMGLPAVRAADGPKPAVGDLVLKGYLLSVDQGSADKRMLVGFGQGAADVRAAVEGYEVTPTGLRLLGHGSTDAASGNTPGLLVGAATLAATGNPVGLLVGGASKVMGESSGSETVEGQAKRTADDIAKAMKVKFQEQGWI